MNKKSIWTIGNTLIISIVGISLHTRESYASSTQESRLNPLQERLVRETQDHILYLTSMGLGERAQGIKVIPFQQDNSSNEGIDLAIFEKRMPLPTEVLEFDPKAKNTLITTDPDFQCNNPADLKRILDVRLYPSLRNLIHEHKIEIFLGTRREMVAYYKLKNLSPLFEFKIPSSARYYLLESKDGQLFVVMAGLVSRENCLAQLLTLKLANIKTETIDIIGDVGHFGHLVKKDMNILCSKIPTLQAGNHGLIIAGCGLKGTVSCILEETFKGNTDESLVFKGDIISLIYTPLHQPINEIHGFISLDLVYGEIMEDITRLFLENCHCKYVFTGGAGGYISKDCNSLKPEIGSRISIIRSMNGQGEIATLGHHALQSSSGQDLFSMHLQIPSIFLETFEWLEKAKYLGSSIDVETFYMIRAIKDYNNQNTVIPVKADCGCFVSDYVGEQPLRDYSKVYQHYPAVLSVFLRNCAKIS